MQWISVKDRLPENGKPVLIFKENLNFEINRYNNGDWEFFNKEIDDWNFSHIDDLPIYWMPLPEPPCEKHEFSKYLTTEGTKICRKCLQEFLIV